MATKRQMNKALKGLDAARSSVDPSPDAVMTAFLGWWDKLYSDVEDVADLLTKFRSEADESEYRPGFEWVDEARSTLCRICSELEGEGRPSPRHRSVDEFRDELLAMLPHAK